MNTITVDYQDKSAILSFNQGPTNPLNSSLFSELTGLLSTLKTNPNVHSLVLTSVSDKFFSIGLDIPTLYDLPLEEFTAIYKSFNQVCLDFFTFPKPTVAAIKGHAIAGGTILTLCCDYRFIAVGRKLMGLNEIKLGVPVPYLADLILQQVVGSRIARQMVESGELYPAVELADFGLVDSVQLLDQVIPKAVEKANSLGVLSGAAYALIKNNRVEAVVRKYNQHRQEKENQFINSWYSPAPRQLLKAAMEKF